MNPEQIRTLSDSLKVMTFSREGATQALHAFCDYFHNEALEQLTAPKVSTEERHYWSGAAGCAMEMRRHFDDLLSGAYQQWPQMRGEDKEE